MGNPNTKASGNTLRRAGPVGQRRSAHRAPGGAPRRGGVRHDRPAQLRRRRRSQRADRALGPRRFARQRPAGRPRQHVGRRDRRLVRRRRSRPLRHRRRRRGSRRRHRPRLDRHDRPRRRYRHRPGLRLRSRPSRRVAPHQAAAGPHGRDAASSGRLPPEVIQRIVRQNFGRFRLCYENGLRNNPNLQGRVSVRFVIGRDGAVSNVRQRRLGHAGQRRGLLRRCARSTACRSRSRKAASSRSCTRSCSAPAADRTMVGCDEHRAALAVAPACVNIVHQREPRRLACRGASFLPVRAVSRCLTLARLPPIRATPSTCFTGCALVPPWTSARSAYPRRAADSHLSAR